MGIQRNMNGLMQSDIFSQTQMSTDTLVQIYKGISISILFYTYIYIYEIGSLYSGILCIQIYTYIRSYTYIHKYQGIFESQICHLHHPLPPGALGVWLRDGHLSGSLSGADR